MVITSNHALSVGVKTWVANTVISAPFENKALFSFYLLDTFE